jgi:hypothetical protein
MALTQAFIEGARHGAAEVAAQIAEAGHGIELDIEVAGFDATPEELLRDLDTGDEASRA